MKKEQVRNIINIIIGSMIMGIGITLTLWANVGSDPMSIFWMGIARTLSITIGQANLLVCAVILVFVFFIDKKQIHVGSFLNPLIIALTTDFLTQITFSLDNYYMRILLCVLGLVVLAFGIACYALVEYGKGAYEALVFCITSKSKASVGMIRTTSDVCFVLMGVMLGGTVAVGTLLAILCMGTGIQFFIKKMA